MSNLGEITSLFATLASNLQALDPMARNEDEDLDLTISNLNRSLNLSETPSVSVLDTALSLMSFTAPQVYDKVIDYTVKTIITVLSSSMECNVLRTGKDEILRVGGTISPNDCATVIEACAEILEKVEARGGHLCPSLLCSVIKVAVLASNFRYAPDLTPIVDAKSLRGRGSACSKLVHYLYKESHVEIGELPLRLLYWNLDPNVLKNDISQIFREATDRPFLCLSMELYENINWRSTVTCLALSPLIFIETRAMLHNWFLRTGVPSALKLQTELVSLVLDVSSRPMWWGMSMEIGAKLPFSHAYIPHNHRLLRILAGPLSCESFQQLVHTISKSVSLAGRYLYTTSQQAMTNIALVDHTSMWAMTMNFPDWFNFASVLLFCNKDFLESFRTECCHIESNCYSSAARFIAWILNPTGKFHQDQLSDYLAKVSESWAMKCKSSGATSHGYKNINQHDTENISLQGYHFHTLHLWLKEFQDMCSTYSRHGAEASKGIGNQQNILLRKIPLGIMIGCSSYLDEEGCKLLLHYAATGIIFQLAEKTQGRSKHRNWNCKLQQASVRWIELYSTKEAISGACVVFDLTDLTESMSISMFESEEIGLNFLSQVKLKAGRYLFKCIKRLLQLKINEDDGFLMLRDLCKRLVRWRDQGRDVFLGDQELDEVIDALNHVSVAL